MSAPTPLVDDGIDPQGFRNPRRRFRRRHGVWSLNGPWRFAVDEHYRWESPSEVQWEPSPVQVPWAPEWPRSGQFRLTPLNRTWTGRTVRLPPAAPGERLLLHFEAVDETATVYVDDEELARHEGGFSPFAVDVTSFAGEARTVVVRADDRLDDASTPRGKQDIKPVPSDVFYNATTGIWRPVTLELVPARHIATLTWTECDDDALALDVLLGGDVDTTLSVEADFWLVVAGERLPLGTQGVPVAGGVHVPIALSNLPYPLPWTPDRPAVVEARTRLVAADGRSLDDVSTYTAHLRWGIVPTGGERRMGRIVLGGSPLYLRGVMNQGYDPQGGMTATHDELTRTYGLMREFGLNLARIHQTVPSAEECEIALRSGILLGIEPPAPRETSRRAMRRTATCWADIARTLAGTPAVALAFVTNETWGVELKTVPGYAVGSPDAEQQRILAEEFPEGFADAVEAQYDRLVGTTLTYFADRLISVSDGWQFRLGRVPLPVLGQHDYQPPALLRERYATGPLVDRLLQGVEPDRELLPPDVDVSLLARTAVILSEMGGRMVETGDGEVLERDPLYLPADPTAPATWAYGTLSPEEYAAEVRAAFAVACSGELSGGVLTQWRDVVIYYLSADGDLLTGGEHNGLLYADGTPKVPGLKVSVG